VTAAQHGYMPPVKCTPWCEDADGHPDCFFTEDQNCWSPATYVDLSLEPVQVEGKNKFPQQLGVMARRRSDGRRHVYLHLCEIKLHGSHIPYPYNYLDHSVNMTSDEAEALGRALLEYADLVRSTPGRDR
jgi:hypothetical protein